MTANTNGMTSSATSAATDLVAGVAPAPAVSWAPVAIPETTPYTIGNQLYQPSCPSNSLCVVGDQYGNILFSTTPTASGDSWQIENIDGTTSILQVACPSTSLCVATDGAGNIFTSSNPTNPASWQKTAVGGGPLNALSCPSTSLCVAGGDNTGVIYTSSSPATGSWHAVEPSDSQNIAALSCSSVNLCIAGDSDGNVYATTTPAAGGWSITAQEENPIVSVYCQSDALCLVSDFGEILVSTNPASGGYSVSTPDPNQVVYGLSCVSSTECVGVDGDGNVLTTSNPTSGTWNMSDIDGTTSFNGLACSANNWCVGTDAQGRIVSSVNPTASWQAQSVDGLDQTFGISCTSASFCVAIQNSGKVLTSSDPGSASSWQSTTVGGNFSAVACVSESFCLAGQLGGTLETSTNPSGGNWNQQAVSGGDIRTLSCATTTLCIAGSVTGNVSVSTTPLVGGSWSTSGVDAGNSIYASTCLPDGTCFIGDSKGQIWASTDPAGGAGTWSVVFQDGGLTITSISCPATGLCVASDSAGNVLSSTSPLTGSWSAAQLAPQHAITDVSCPTTTDCTAVDNQGGHVWNTTDPTGGVGAWTVSYAYTSNNGLTAMSCPLASFCVGAGEIPEIVVGNAQLPTISGSLGIGQVLTTTAGAWSGSTPQTDTYQWQDCSAGSCQDISGATNASYTVAPADEGSSIDVVITATNTAGADSMTALPTGVVAEAAPGIVAAPNITGTATDGQLLTASSGSFSGGALTYSYQWQESTDGNTWQNISGATTSTYSLRATDVAERVRVEVTASNSAGSATGTSTATQPVADITPSSTIAPVVSGISVEGDALTSTTGSFTGDNLSYSYQWQELTDGIWQDLSGATSSSYTIQAGDVGASIRVLVTATNSAGNAVGTSSATGSVTPVAPANTGLPVLSGTAQVGQALTSSPGAFSGVDLTISYQWQACDSTGASCEDIPGATSASYTPIASEVGQTLRATVTATNSGGSISAESPVSAAIAPVPVSTGPGNQGPGTGPSTGGPTGPGGSGSGPLPVSQTATLSSSNIFVKGRAVAITLTCPVTDSSCVGKLQAMISKHSLTAAVAFTIPGGQSKTIQLRLTHYGTSMLRKLSIRATLKIGTANHLIRIRHARTFLFLQLG